MALQVCACAAMGLGIFVTPGLDPDFVVAEAGIIGICLIVETVCAFSRIRQDRR